MLTDLRNELNSDQLELAWIKSDIGEYYTYKNIHPERESEIACCCLATCSLSLVACFLIASICKMMTLNFRDEYQRQREKD